MNTLQKKLNGKRPLGIYFESWTCNWSSNSDNLDLTKIDLPINIVFLSFVNPNCSYKSGSNTFTGTGLDFSSDFNVVKGSIAKLRSKGIIVMLSVGGATYPFTTFNADNIANFCNDLGCDGVDIDWEDPSGFAAASKLGPIINKMRKSLPDKLISLAGFSVGAYGQGKWLNATPSSSNTGMNVEGLKSNGFQLDFICIMSYDAGPTYDAITAYEAFSSVFSGPLLIGEEVPPEAWGRHVLNLKEVETHCQYLMKKPNTSGLFVWSYQKSGSPNCMDIIKTANNIFKNNSNVTPLPPAPTPPQPIPVNPTPPQPQPVKINNWEVNKVYKKNDVVMCDGIAYKCEMDNTSNDLLKPNVKIWSVVNQNTTNGSVNTWKENVNYKVNDNVIYNGQNYKCINAHSSILSWNPEVAITLWIKI